MNWSEGYVTDVGYTRGYYRELSSALQSFSLAATGHEPPDLEKPFTKVELGCGYGVSLIMEAVNYPHAQFFGVDFNPEHIAWAKRIASDAGLDNVHFLEMSFSELLSSSIPQAEFVVLHGVWSWVSDANREAILQFLDRRLKSGGVAMVSFNTLPGWSGLQGLRELMMRRYRSLAGPPQTRIKQALRFATEFKDVGAQLFARNPGLAEYLEKITVGETRYLAHEFFNQDWGLFYHHQVADRLAQARLSYASSCKLTHNIDRFNMPPSALALAEQVAPSERETLKDIYLNRAFRFDIFSRGLEQSPIVATIDHVLNCRFAMIDDRSKVAGGEVVVPVGKSKIKIEMYDPVLRRLEAGPATGQELAVQTGAMPLKNLDLIEVLSTLLDIGVIGIGLSQADFESRKLRTTRLNAVLQRRVLKGDNLAWLASPMTSSAIIVPDYIQMYIVAQDHGVEPISFAWQTLKALSKRMARDGKTLPDEADNIAELQTRFEEFKSDIGPRLTKLGILN